MSETQSTFDLTSRVAESSNPLIDPDGVFNTQELETYAANFEALSQDAQAELMDTYMRIYVSSEGPESILKRSRFLLDAIIRHCRNLVGTVDNETASAVKDLSGSSAEHMFSKTGADLSKILGSPPMPDSQRIPGPPATKHEASHLVGANGTLLPSTSGNAARICFKLAPDLVAIDESGETIADALLSLARDADLLEIYNKSKPTMAYRCQSYFNMWSELTSKKHLIAVQDILTQQFHSASATRFDRELRDTNVPHEISACASGIIEAETRHQVYARKWQGADYLLAVHIYRCWSSCRKFLKDTTAASATRRRQTKHFLKREVARLANAGQIDPSLMPRRWNCMLKIWMAHKLSKFMNAEYSTTEEAMRHIQHCNDLGSKITALVASLQLPRNRAKGPNGLLGFVLLIPDGNKVMLRDISTRFLEQFNGKLINRCPGIARVARLVHDSLYEVLWKKHTRHLHELPTIVGTKWQREAWTEELKSTKICMIRLFEGNERLRSNDDW